VKVIHKKDLKEERRIKRVYDEIRIMVQINSPNVVSLRYHT